eukprot:354149-Chlamydomonas_euryale.AAC.3
MTCCKASLTRWVSPCLYSSAGGARRRPLAAPAHCPVALACRHGSLWPCLSKSASTIPSHLPDSTSQPLRSSWLPTRPRPTHCAPAHPTLSRLIPATRTSHARHRVFPCLPVPSQKEQHAFLSQARRCNMPSCPKPEGAT